MSEIRSSEGRVPPNNLEAEASVLGGILLSNPAIDEVLERGLGPEDFYHPSHRAIFEAMVDLSAKSEPIDTVSVASVLKAQDSNRRTVIHEGFLAELAARVPTSANVGFYAKKVKEASSVRKVIAACGEVQGKGFSNPPDVPDYLDWVDRRVGEAIENQSQRSFIPIKEIVGGVAENIAARADNKNAVTGVTTGYADLDRFTAGLQSCDLILLAGRPSQGKTALALNIVRNAAVAGIPSVVFSLEMSKESCTERVMCLEGKIDSQGARTGRMEKNEWSELTRSTGAVSLMDIDIDDTSASTLMEIRAKSRRWKRVIEAQLRATYPELADEERKKQLKGLIVIDYLQLMAGVGNSEREESRERTVAEISKGLKNLAKELSIPVMALCQLNRDLEKRGDKRPILSDLRESGSLEQDSDVIFFIYRPCKYEEDRKDDKTAEVIIGKQRNGPTGTVELIFLDHCGRFENKAQGDDREYR